MGAYFCGGDFAGKPAPRFGANEVSSTKAAGRSVAESLLPSVRSARARRFLYTVDDAGVCSLGLLRSLRAQLLLWSILGSYALYWLLARIVGRERLSGWLDRLHIWNARRLARGFTRLAGVYIKVGQVLSVVGTFLPRAFGEALEVLQDQVPARPFATMQRRLHSLGSSALDRFREIEPEPVAAASLAQVHRATTREGRRVAVKILYPNIERMIARDLGVFRTVMPVLRWIFPVISLPRVLEQLTAMLRHETDFANERRNLADIAEMFAKRSDVIVPTVVDDLSTDSVLTMSFEDGIRISDLDSLDAAGIDRTALARLLVDAYVTMLMEHRRFHADPHPGNFLVRPGPQLVILDFGAVESVSRDMTEGLKTALAGVVGHDDGLVLDGLERMGFVAPSGNRDLLAEVSREYLRVLGQVKLADFSQLDLAKLRDLVGWNQLRGRMREVMRSVEYPPGFFYVERAMILLFGLVGRIAPAQGMPGLVLPYATQALARRRARMSTEPPSA